MENGDGPGWEEGTDSDATVSLEEIPLHSSNLLTLLDGEGIIRYESPAIERIFGFEQEELLGERVTALFHPEDRGRVVDAFESVVTSEEERVEAVTYRHERADGPYQWVESVASSTPTSDGLYVVNTREISAQKQRERQLERFREALESTGHAVFITDVDGTIEYVNEAFTAVTGYDREEAIGETPSILKSGEMDESYYERLWETILSGEVWTEAIVNRRKSGERYHASQTISPITTDGEVTAFVSVQEDVTEREEREARLERQNERLDQFAAVVSHDLRNPLNVAELRLDLARQTGDDSHLDDVAQAHERMTSLIEDILALTTYGEQVTDLEAVDLGAVSTRCWQIVATGDATLEIEIDRRITADSSRLQQLFENLIRNAIDHGGDDVTITVGELPDAGFFLADDGPGIAETDRSEVFTPGYSTGEQGSGLGLAIAREIAHAHEWDIRMTESHDGGARAEITGVEFR